MAARRGGASAFIHFSSVMVYGFDFPDGARTPALEFFGHFERLLGLSLPAISAEKAIEIGQPRTWIRYLTRSTAYSTGHRPRALLRARQRESRTRRIACARRSAASAESAPGTASEATGVSGGVAADVAAGAACAEVACSAVSGVRLRGLRSEAVAVGSGGCMASPTSRGVGCPALALRTLRIA